MARKIIEQMECIFGEIKRRVSGEDADRIAQTNRHIKADGNEEIVCDFVKNAIIKKIPVPDFAGCVFVYKGIKYLVVSTEYSSALREIGFDEYIVSEENTDDELEITQGCEMLSISQKIIGIRPENTSLTLIEKCLGIEGDNGNITFEFSELRPLFIETSIFIIDDSRFSLQYDEDFYRLCCYCICDCDYGFKGQVKSVIKALLLLESSRSISVSVINGLRSTLKEYSFLQYYQCLEYLFRLNNSFDLQDKFSIGVSESIGIVTDYDFKLAENENLRRVITNNTSETDVDAFYLAIGEIINVEDTKEKKCEKISSQIYKIRCRIAHLRYGQDTYLETLDWNQYIEGITKLVLSIYQRCGTRVERTCIANNAWHEIDFSKNS